MRKLPITRPSGFAVGVKQLAPPPPPRHDRGDRRLSTLLLVDEKIPRIPFQILGRMEGESQKISGQTRTAETNTERTQRRTPSPKPVPGSRSNRESSRRMDFRKRCLPHALSSTDDRRRDDRGPSGNQNIWGLSEKFLPSWVEKKNLTEEDFEREAAQRALQALGTASPREIHVYFPRARYLNLKKTLERLQEESTIHRVHVTGLDGKDERYVHDKDIRLLESMNSDAWDPRMSLLPPFDNLVCERSRTNRIFGFDYLHENFLPESKRKFGTFVHPILYGDKLIGRADMHTDRKNAKLF